jgi:hypothetical protein
MGRADFIRSHNDPARSIPKRGKITDDDGKSAGNKVWAVFHEHESRSNFANDARHFRPKSGSRAADTGAFPGATNVLTGEAAANDVNQSAPGSAVKVANIIPDRKRRKASVVLPGDKYPDGIRFAFNGADGPPSADDSAKDPAAGASE